MADSKKIVNKTGKNKLPSNEQIVSGFNQLRQEQRALMTKIAELEGDQNEHRLINKYLSTSSDQIFGQVLISRYLSTSSNQRFGQVLVLETLKEVDADRRCFRLVGGVLVERTVKDVIPALDHNKEQLSKLVETLNKQVETKGKEINEYREKYNIRVRGEQPVEQAAEDKKTASTQGVLVANTSSIESVD